MIAQRKQDEMTMSFVELVSVHMCEATHASGATATACDNHIDDLWSRPPHRSVLV